MRRLVLVPLLLALTACSKAAPSEGAVKLTVSYEGFLPRCVRVTVKDVELTQETRTTELLGKGDARGGALTVAIFREPRWGHTLELTAEAFEKANGPNCDGASAVRQTQTVTVGTTVEEPTLRLVGQDADEDGFLAVTSQGGTDCDDSRAEAKPGAMERCNALDDNCDGTRDEGLDVGGLCDGSNSCQGAWTCTPDGERQCSVRRNQWYPDGDKDGHGARNGTPQDACQQPPGHVPNNTDCDDTNPLIRPGATELCNAVDEDCDNDPLNGLNVNGACNDGACPGVRACVADGGVECKAPTPFTLLPDLDNDGYGARGATPISFCQRPDGGFAVDGGDCNDGDPQRNPGVTERCNGQDDNCDSVSDDTAFALDTACAPDGGCTGKRACDGLGEVTCQILTHPTTWYPDEDLDTHGKADGGVALCELPDGGGYVDAGTDCDDGDPYTYTGAPELCDVKDNDCNTTVDEGTGVCPGTGATWKEYTQSNRTWHKLALWGEGGVWVAGEGGPAVKRPRDTSFTLYDTHCGGDWFSVWADPVSGRAYLGGTSDALAIQDVGGAACVNKPPSAKEDTLGLMGFRSSTGVALHGVGSKPDFTGGWLFNWDGSNTPQPYTEVKLNALFDIHGLSPELLFAVGGPVSPSEPRIYRYNPTTEQWVLEPNVPTANLNRLNDVWVVHSKLAYAVGDGGSILKWNGTAWSRLPFNNGSTSALTGVLAFGPSALYVTTASGSVFRYNGTAWQELTNIGNRNIQDIAGTSPADLWIAGDNGRILHWPQ
jgi:hypothetical protein